MSTMIPVFEMTRLLMAAMFIGSLFGVVPGLADEVVAPGTGSLQQAIARAIPGSVLHLKPGIYSGPVVVDKPITVQGTTGSVVESNRQGSVLTLTAPDVTVSGLTIRGSGMSEPDLDSGIHATKTAARARIENNSVRDNLFGITIQGAPAVVVRANHIANRNDLWINFQGNGIQIWNSTGSLFEDNRIEGGRDGVYIHTAHGNIIRNNHFSDLRFAVHYMYANNNEISGNISRNNHVGYALMYSNNLKVLHNRSFRDRDHGLMFHSANRSEVAWNQIRETADKCAFIYVATRNAIHDNLFEGCNIGIHYNGASEQNQIWNNAFVNNRTQVKYQGTAWFEWSQEGRGNYWSDNAAFDLDGNGVADVAYRPNTVVDRIVWRYPLAKLLLSSPVMEVIRFAQSQFPALYPGGVVDSWPLMAPAES